MRQREGKTAIMQTERQSVRTRVAAEGQLSRGGVRVADVEVPVLVDPRGGGVGVPAGVGEEQVLKARRHLGTNQREGEEPANQREEGRAPANQS